MITMRLYNDKDYKKVIKFMKSVDRDFSPPIDERSGGLEGYLNEILSKNYKVYILEDHKFFMFFPKIVGVLLTFKEGEKKVIKYIAISEEYRKFGHGKSLLETCLSDIRKAKEVIIRTWSSNKKALALYRKLGFKSVKKVKDIDRPKGEKSVHLKIKREELDNSKKKRKIKAVSKKIKIISINQ